MIVEDIRSVEDIVEVEPKQEWNMMANITKCTNWNGCPKAETCARCPEEKEKKYFFGESFHPEAPWLCFWKREVESEKETPDTHEPHSNPYEATISKERRETGDY